MISSDFQLISVSNDEYKDYWYKVFGETKRELTKMYMEQSMVEVTSVVYSKAEDVIGVKRLFPFNYSVIIVENEELHNILKELSK